MQKTARFWDKVAAKYAKMPIRDTEAYEYTLDRTRSYLKDTDKVLELGCGTGSTALRLAGHADTIVASDISGQMLEVGQQRAQEQGTSNVRFVKCDATGVPGVPGGPYDAVMAFNLLHLIRDLDGTLTCISGLVKPGGVFISKTFCKPENGGSLMYWMIRVALPVLRLLGKAPDVTFRRIAELETAIARAGFEIIETGNYPAKPPSRYIVARKL